MPWALDGRDVDVTGWTYSAGSLSLQVRIHASNEYVRDLEDDTEGAPTVTFSDGRREAAETRMARRLTVTPPERFRPMLIQDEFVLEGYRESSVDGGSAFFDVQLSLQRGATRTVDGGYGYEYGDSYGDRYPGFHESAAAGEWAFRFEHGDIAVDDGLVSGGETSEMTATLDLVLSPEQGEVLLETLGTVASVNRQPVPDGQAYYEDNHPEDRNTVRITPPDSLGDEYPTPGEYVVSSWRVERGPGSSVWAASLTVSKVRSTMRAVGQLGGSRYGHTNYGDSQS